jgi:ubiquitin C-terminal hydrolase
MYIKPKVVFIDQAPEAEDCFYCKTCNYALTSFQDFNLHKEYNACHECFMTFVESRKLDWKNGWRPDKTKLKQYIYLRKQAVKLINNNK